MKGIKFTDGVAAARITLSGEDNLWHYFIDGRRLTLCGKRISKRIDLKVTAGQEVMERLTGRDVYKCLQCEEIASNERLWRQRDIGGPFSRHER